MIKIIKKYSNLKNEQLGELVKLIIQYEENKTIKGDVSEQMQIFFISQVKKEIDKKFKQRENTKRYRERKQKK